MGIQSSLQTCKRVASVLLLLHRRHISVGVRQKMALSHLLCHPDSGLLPMFGGENKEFELDVDGGRKSVKGHKESGV